MTVYLYLDKDNILEGWSSTYSEGTVEAKIDPVHPLLMELGLVKYVDGQLVKDEGKALQEAREAKEKELSKACQESILEGFSHTIDGEEYWFSFDIEAQLNFQGAERMLMEGMVDSVKWTVRKGGEYHRITITPEIMKDLSLVILMHKTNNISKYRDELMVMVEQATTVDEVNTIEW